MVTWNDRRGIIIFVRGRSSAYLVADVDASVFIDVGIVV
jgi:hypothetical protein